KRKHPDMQLVWLDAHLDMKEKVDNHVSHDVVVRELLKRGFTPEDIWLVGITRVDDDEDAYKAIRAVFHSLRDRLTVEEAVDLGAQLPNPLRGVYYAGWKPAQCPVKLRTREEFLDYVQEHLPDGSAVKPYAATRAVFQALEDHVSEGEIEDVTSILTEEIRELWHEPAT
ncbi:MAG: DUF2267 domain-containing protein, partial [bacterium]